MLWASWKLYNYNWKNISNIVTMDTIYAAHIPMCLHYLSPIPLSIQKRLIFQIAFWKIYRLFLLNKVNFIYEICCATNEAKIQMPFNLVFFLNAFLKRRWQIQLQWGEARVSVLSNMHLDVDWVFSMLCRCNLWCGPAVHCWEMCGESSL